MQKYSHAFSGPQKCVVGRGSAPNPAGVRGE